MKFATLDTGGDGRLLLVSKDLRRAVEAQAALSMQAALERWDDVAPALRAEYDALQADTGAGFAIDESALAAVLPRGYQFLDASAFLAHNHILAEAWGFEKRGEDEPPLMYQGLSNRFFAPHEAVDFPAFGDDIDFEAEFGILTDRVPRGIAPAEALRHARLVIFINDWSLRAYGPSEMRGGFGFLHAKPPSTLSAFAVTPDELGPAWRDGRVCLPLTVRRNGELFGRPDGAAMHFGFGELIAHAAYTRELCAATVIGSGTVSNYDAEKVGSACIAERRALDQIAGRAITPYLGDGEVVEIEADAGTGSPLLGGISQAVRILA